MSTDLTSDEVHFLNRHLRVEKNNNMATDRGMAAADRVITVSDILAIHLTTRTLTVTVPRGWKVEVKEKDFA